jgi:DNA primase
MALPPGFLDELRSRVSLAQVVGRKLTWDPRKSNAGKGDFWAPCPFHHEKTASFHVDDRKGFYHCFGCHAGGDVFKFLAESENLGFMEAVETLAREAGLPLPERDPRAAERAAAAQGLGEAMEAAIRFYRMQLASGRAAEARAYLDRRGLSAETRDRFELGYAPDGRTALLDHLTDKGFPRDKLIEAGLVGRRDDGSAYDRFRNRIMFPIRDGRDRAIAFGARALTPGQEPKYLNSPETPLFDKGRSLYNIGPARSAAGRAGALVVVEGYMDVIALVEAGIGHAVAPLGTAVTEDQLALLWRIADEPVIALDGDAAGLKAAQRVVDLALPLMAAGKSLRFALMPPGQDPDDVVRAGGARAFEALVAASRPVVDLLWQRETEGQVLDSPERRAALDARLRAHLDRIRDPSLRAHYQAEFRARRNAIFAPARPAHAGKGGGPGAARGAPSRTRGRAWLPVSPSPAAKASMLAAAPAGPQAEARVREGAILLGCISHPALVARFEERLERLSFVCPDLEMIRAALLSCLAETPDHESPDSTQLAGLMTARLGHDPLAALLSIGQLRANPHLGPAAEPDRAAAAIDEELGRHAAQLGATEEVREAEQALAGSADEGLTWRLRQAADARHLATARPLEDAGTGADEADLSRHLSSLLEQQVWKKPKKH